MSYPHGHGAHVNVGASVVVVGVTVVGTQLRRLLRVHVSVAATDAIKTTSAIASMGFILFDLVTKYQRNTFLCKVRNWHFHLWVDQEKKMELNLKCTVALFQPTSFTTVFEHFHC
jgi:hypothetical protein